METWCVIVAGGQGSRFGSLKQFAPLGQSTVLDRSIRTALNVVDGVIVVTPKGMTTNFQSSIVAVQGGDTRSESVRAGLAVLPETTTHVLVHDAVRPFASEDLFRRVIDELTLGADVVVPSRRVTETIKEHDEDGGLKTLDRERLVSIQTPQGFRVEVLREAHLSSPQASDDSQLAEELGYTTKLIDGEQANIKITYPSDLPPELGPKDKSDGVEMGRPPWRIRVGTGFDMHAFSKDPDRRLVLCGVAVAGVGLAGHSDADVGCHAMADAMLGAVGLGGIGDHFSDSDPRYWNADSLELLRRSAELCREVGYVLSNGDLTLICDTPKLAPYRLEMERVLSLEMGAPVSVKAKRTEGLGALGRSEGIASIATVMMVGE